MVNPGGEFLHEHERVVRWTGKAVDGAQPDLVCLGNGDHALEVAIASSPHRPTADALRRLYKERHGGRPSPVLLVITYTSGHEERAYAGRAAMPGCSSWRSARGWARGVAAVINPA